MSVYRSPESDIEIPDVTLTEHVLGGAAARGDHPAIIDGPTGEVTTYAELAARVDAVAALLQAEGIGKGDVVGLVGPNSAAWAIAYHAILRIPVYQGGTPPYSVMGGAWVYDEFGNGGGVASLGLEDKVPQAPSSEERNGILDMFRR